MAGLSLTSKEEFEKWYEKKNPWNFNDSITDLVRRSIFIWHVEKAFAETNVKKVLDAGCGEGYLTKDLAKIFDVKIDAFDISENAVKYAEQLNGSERINYFQLDIRDFYKEEDYDLIFCEEALYYINDAERNQVIRNFFKSLRPNGYLKLSVVCIGENEHRKYFTIEEIKSLLTQNGFKIKSLFPSVLARMSFFRRMIFRVFSKLYLLFKQPAFLTMLRKTVLKSPLKDCYQISILAKK